MVRRFSLLLCFLLIYNLCSANTLRIGLVDTGLSLSDSRFTSHLCERGHKDFTGKGIEDNNGHGTHIAGIITSRAKASCYCLVILKYWNNKNSGYFSTEAFIEAAKLGLDIVNFSSVGNNFDRAEFNIMAISGITYIVAAGNDGLNLDDDPRFPAYYELDNITTIGNLSPNSNYGSRIKIYINGNNILSTLPDGKMGYMSGSSMSTAIYTSEVINKLCE